MNAIKIHLDPAEHAVLSRYATALNVSLEDVGYAALDRLMQNAHNPEVRKSIVEIRAWRRENLPIWADTERSVHAYEGGSDDQPIARMQFEKSPR